MSGEVVFEPLPPDGRIGGNAPEASWKQPLRDRPGEWARLPVGGASSGEYRRRFGPQGFEFLSRLVDGKRVLYGRYIGVNGEHA